MITKRSPAPYGFDLTQADHRLLRTSPPAEALRWCAAAIAPGAEIVRVQPLAGGMSSAVHAVDVEDGRRRVHRLVLRRMVRPELLEEEPDILHREATVLEVVRGCALPTPELVALDADAEATDVPALLMTRVPGSVDWQPTDLEGYLADSKAIGQAYRAHFGRHFGATALIEVSRLADRGFRMALAGMTLPNDASVGLHRAMGFEPVGTYRRIGFKHGRWHDVAWTQRVLAAGGDEPPAEPR